jgi:UDP-4-amino-4,6-dideoxy-N-acetyl-beta-L-altrosamine transaminase
MLPYGRQSIDQADIDAVVEVLRSDWLTQGPLIEQFEQAVADYCGVKYAVAVSNGTAALHLAAMALGLKPGGLLWTSPITFVASANCARYCGADVDFVDINPLTYNLDVGELEAKLKRAAKEGRLPSVVAPVHLAGQSCEMAAIGALAREYGFAVMEDAAHAIGGSYQRQPVGSCRCSDLAIFSFHPVKIITSAEGGMIVTNRPELHERLLRLRTHGITRDPIFMTEPPHGPWYYQQIELGYNYRLTDVHAALGLSQLRRIDHFVARRRLLAARYNELLAGLPVQLPWQHPDSHSSWHLYILRLQTERLHRSHREIFEAMRAAGIGVNLHYIPVHLQPYYQKLGFKPGDFPEAEKYYGEALSLPLYHDLSEEQQDQVVGALKGSLAP